MQGAGFSVMGKELFSVSFLYFSYIGTLYLISHWLVGWVFFVLCALRYADSELALHYRQILRINIKDVVLAHVFRYPNVNM